jgi:hypothetical protein
VGSFTDDRDALVVNDDGGKLIHTRVYSASENGQERNSIIQLDASGNATITVNARYNGVLYDDKYMFYLAGTEDKKKMILDEVDLPGAVLKKFDYRDIRAEVPAIAENLQFDVPRYSTLAGSRILVSVIPLDRLREVPKKVSNRKSDVIIRRSKIAIDTVTIMIPEGYQVEAVPVVIKAESKFGTYVLQSVAQDKKIICIRRLEIKKGQHPPSSYNELIDFYKKIAAGDNTKVGLKKAVI